MIHANARNLMLRNGSQREAALTTESGSWRHTARGRSLDRDALWSVYRNRHPLGHASGKVRTVDAFIVEHAPTDERAVTRRILRQNRGIVASRELNGSAKLQRNAT
jgi:hypothetical protein